MKKKNYLHLSLNLKDDELGADGKSRSSGNQYFSQVCNAYFCIPSLADSHISIFFFFIFIFTQAEKRAHHNALERKRRDVSC